MTKSSELRSVRRFAASSAIAVAMVAGLVGVGSISSADAGRSRSEKAEAGRLARAVGNAEQAVTRAAHDPAARVALARAYLAVGRFESAADAFADAMQLGDTSNATVLGLALAQVAIGENPEAAALLRDFRDQLPASDLGLALALTGESGRGVAVLADALRNGENTPKLRQNLAYAYALDGRWREARLMAEQDVPADQIDARLSDWAMRAHPDAFRQRVAGLLGVPVRADSGQPAQLALNGDAPALAAAAAAPVAAAVPGELPPVSTAPAVAAPVAAAESAVAPAVAATEPDQEYVQPQFTATPVVQAIPVRATPTFSLPVRARAARQSVRPAAASLAALDPAKCTHLVQLGAFSSQSNARRAWAVFNRRNPELGAYRLSLTQARVHGKTFWRVAAAGLDAHRATGLCSSVKGRGGACFAYATTRAPAGAVPTPRGVAGPMRARR